MNVALARSEAALEDRWSASEGWFYMTGMQALVRLPIQQRLRDAAAGLNTGGYISGYRGSPMGRYDIELWRAEAILKGHNIVFRPGLNEDLAATAIWGAQHLTSFPGATVDGVFGIWYGKGPGVDRSGDALRHANFTGASPKGGAIALAGDDHGAKSSTAVNFSDTSFVAVGMPVLYPSNTQELIDFGLHGIAMSRFSGCWVGIKVVTDVAEGGGTVYVGPDSPTIVIPERPSSPPGGVGARTIDMPVMQEERLYNHKLPAALAYARANQLNQIVCGGADARVGVVAAGKAWQDLLQALSSLGLADEAALDLRLFKVGMVWPLDPVAVRDFAQGLDLIVVVEEKRPLLEDQIRSILYGRTNPPRIVGKFFEGLAFDPSHGPAAIPNHGETTPELVAEVLVKALRQHDPNCVLSAPAPLGKALSNRPPPVRNPGFCAGCPHNRSTKVPEGSRALAGIGCHWMAVLVNPLQTSTSSHMGGEGTMWLGQQPFTTEQHVFANIGDGTYAHSGSLAIRQAIAADVPITYKILYNGFVSMTGGQPIEGGMTPIQILAELAAEGVKKMALVVDDPGPLSRRSAAARRQPPPPRRDGRDAARVPRVQGRLGNPLRSALRDRAPPPAQARQMGRSGHPHVHPCRSLRRLRRLRKSLQLHGDRAAGDRIGPQAAHQPVELQQGFFLRRGLLPELRHRPRGTLAKGGHCDAVERLLAADPRADASRDRRALQRAGGRHRRLGRRHRQPDARRRRLSRRALQLQSRPHRPEPEIRRRHRARAHGAQSPKRCTRRESPRAKPMR